MKGGRRPGAGRPVGSKGKKTLARETLKAYFDEQARREFAPVLVQYFRRAKGLSSDADPRILIDLLNRLLGKSPDSVQLEGREGTALAVRIVHHHLAEEK